MKKMLAGLSVLFIAIHGFSQGSLTPPGAPGATMKTLDQVEPRTAITNLPVYINQSGSYYLTGNLSSADHGLVIQADGVTVDLMGFAISGDGDTFDYGVKILGVTNSPLRGITVKNGRISQFGNGMFARYVSNSRFERLSLIDNASRGVELSGWAGQCIGNIVADCVISGSGGIGIYFDGSSGGMCNGNTVDNCSVVGCGNAGIYFYGVDGECTGNSITRCVIGGNTGGTADGVRIYAGSGTCDGNRVINCAIESNEGNGISVSTTDGSCNYNVVSGNAVAKNEESGVYLSSGSGVCNGNAVVDNTISESGVYGLALRSVSGGECDGNTVRANRLSDNTSRGIYLSSADNNRVEDNHIYNSGLYGINSSSTSNNLVVRNFASGNDDNYFLNNNDTFGPEVTSQGALPTTGAGAHPWANFSR